GGIAAATKPPIARRKTTNTSVVARHRGRPRLTHHETAGSNPVARKKAIPISTNTDDNDPRTRTIPYVTATPADAVNPMQNGDRRLNRRPGEPSGRSSDLN